MPAVDALSAIIRERGPLTVAAFIEFALYDPEFGYYARAPQRSGRAGDFFTSVDVGALFGRLLAVQVAEMATLLGVAAVGGPAPPPASFDLVEAGAGNGRLSADVLRALQRDAPSVYARARLHLVEASMPARIQQLVTLGDTSEHLASSEGQLPAAFEGVLLANELLDALPVHQVVMRTGGLREVYVDIRDGALVTTEGPPSTPALSEYLATAGAALEPGWRVEIGLAAVAWIREAARRMQRGFVILIDYGHPARELYSVTHAGGTLTSYVRHTMAGPERESAECPWLSNPGEQDITAHVDFTSVIAAARSEGLVLLGFLDQTYFLMGLCGAAGTNGVVNLERLGLSDRLALKTLLMPGGLGSTMKVLILGKNVDEPRLQGCSYRMRAT